MQAPSTANRDNWPPDYVGVWKWRQEQVLKFRNNPSLDFGAKEYYRTRPVEFINHWVDTYDPRNAGRGMPSRIPLICFQRQYDLVQFLMSCLRDEEGGLIEKARDMGATWVCCGFSVWLWLFWRGAAVGWGSRKEQLVDRIGDPDSIFEKIRMILRGLPKNFLPVGFSEDCMTYMKIINPENDCTITGEAGDNIGRGGRKLIYFKDESAHYERPEKIEAALADNTRVPIDISSVNGTGNVFHRRRENGQIWTPDSEMEKGRTRVFIMDWSDHPAKNQEWYDNRKKKAIADGLVHIFAQEVDRDYSSAVEGIVIPSEWVNACVDAHIKLGIEITGGICAALDVADGGNDKNALVARRGILLFQADEWGDRDPAATARTSMGKLEGLKDVDFQYDCIGVGSGVKGEINNFSDQGGVNLPKGITFTPWNAGAGVLFPDQRVIPDDEDSPINQDFYDNLKAQGWWELRLRCYKTWRMVNGEGTYNHDELISLDSKLPLLHQIKKEISQPTAAKSGKKLKMVINKTPDGTKSPNLGDATMMAYWPVHVEQSFGILVKSRHR